MIENRELYSRSYCARSAGTVSSKSTEGVTKRDSTSSIARQLQMAQHPCNPNQHRHASSVHSIIPHCSDSKKMVLCRGLAHGLTTTRTTNNHSMKTSQFPLMSMYPYPDPIRANRDTLNPSVKTRGSAFSMLTCVSH